MSLTIIISIIVAAVILVFITVFAVYDLKGVNQRLVDNVNGHAVEVKTGDGFARLTIDGKIADEITCLWKTSSTLQGKVDDMIVEVDIRKDFGRYRIITFIDGVKKETLSN